MRVFFAFLLVASTALGEVAHEWRFVVVHR